MKRFIAGLCATLILIVGAMTTPAGPARSQGLVEYALVLVLVALDDGVPKRLLWYPDAGRDRGRQPGDTVTWTYIVTNVGASSGQVCRQTFKATLPAADGSINRMVVALGPNRDSLIVDGKNLGNLDPCFLMAADGDIVAEIGTPLQPELTRDLRGPGPMAPPSGAASAAGLFLHDVWVDSLQCPTGGGYVIRTGG